MDCEIDKKDLALRDAVVDGALQLVPVLGSIYASAKTYRERIEEVNQEAFFEEVNTYPGISREKLLSNTFARRVVITMEAASKTENVDKIRMLARMLRLSANVEAPLEFDDYKYYVDLVDDLSPKELGFLDILYDVSTDLPDDEDMGAERWFEFEKLIAQRLNIPKTEIQSFIDRLSRTGCLLRIPLIGSAVRARHSHLYLRLRRFIIEESNKISI
jgi:hypothetical protein